MAILDNIIPFIKNEEEKVGIEELKILGKFNGKGIEKVKEIFNKFKGEPQQMNLPTAPQQPIIVLNNEDRPQPRLDRDRGGGMTISVGRLKKNENVLKFTSVSHNTIRGAAGASVLNAELAYKKGLM